MNNCTHGNFGDKCQYQKYFNTDNNIGLETDKEGRCLFHSSDINWKKELGFHEKLEQLLDFMEADEKSQIVLENIIFPNDRIFILSNRKFAKSFYTHGCIFSIGLKIEKCIFTYAGFQGTLFGFLEVKDCNFYYTVTFDSAKFNDEAIFENVIFHSEPHENFKHKSMISFEYAKFNQEVTFKNCRFNALTEFDNCKFLFMGERANEIDLPVEFKNCIFEYEISFRSAYFERRLVIYMSTFRYNGIFKKTIFSNHYETRFIKNIIEGNVSFTGTREEKIFRFNTIMDFEEKDVSGRIFFENADLRFLNSYDMQKIVQMSKSEKVTIGRGCIKYRLQTPTKKIIINEDNQSLLIEFTNTFTNYFQLNTSYYLGVEIVERGKDYISLFYFTDENISIDEFFNNLGIIETEFSQFLNDGPEEYLRQIKKSNNKLSENKIINFIDGITALTGIFFRVGIRLILGKWTLSNTEALLSSFNNSLIEPSGFHYKLIQRYENNFYINSFINNNSLNIQKGGNMKIENINAQSGSQVNIADKIGKIVFNESPNLTKIEFEEIRKGISKFTIEQFKELEELAKEVTNISKEEHKNNTVERAREFLINNGIPVAQGFTASAIFEILKLYLCN